MRFLIFFLIVLMSACSREPLTGTAYVIKGDGSVTRAASIEVLALPFSSAQEVDSLIDALNSEREEMNLRVYQASLCSDLPRLLDDLIQEKRNRPSNFSSDCTEERRRVSDFITSGLTVDQIRIKIAELESKSLQQLSETARMLENDAQNGVRVSLVFEETDQFDFGYALIENNSPYDLLGYGDKLAGFADGLWVKLCPFGFVGLKAGETAKFDLGTCRNTAAGEQLLESEGAKVCWQKNQLKGLCLDDFGTIETDNSAKSGFKRSNWIFKKKRDDGAIDFLAEARLTREFKQKEDDLSQLKLKLLASRSAIDSLDKCDNHHSEIEAEVEQVKSFSCPVEGASKAVLQKFYEKGINLGLQINAPPSAPMVMKEDVLQDYSIQRVRTNIDGHFEFDALPSSPLLLFAKYRDNFNTLEWLVPVGADVTSIELNNSNAR